MRKAKTQTVGGIFHRGILFTVIFIDIFIVQSRQNKGDFMLLFAPFYLQGEINVRAHFNVIADRRFSSLWKVATAAGCETDADALWNIVSSNCGTQKNALNFN